MNVGMWSIVMLEDFITGTGQKLKIHPKEECKGHYCACHNPSDHHMKDWPLHWRDDRGFFERIDPMGVGHPDPDEIAYHKQLGRDISLHGCNSYCNPDFYKKRK